MLVGLRAGIAFLGTAIHVGDNIVADNAVAGVIAGIVHLGTSLADATVVRSNVVAAGFYGIVDGLDLVRIADNEIFGLTTQLARLGIPAPKTPDDPQDPLNPNPCAPDGVVYIAGPVGVVTSVGRLRGDVGLPAAIFVIDGLGYGGRIESVRVEGNEIVEFLGYGILVLAAVATAMIHDNRVARVSLDGIVITGVRGGAASVNNNVVREVGYKVREQRHTPAADRRVLAAIAIGPLQEADVRANQLLGVRSDFAQSLAGVWIEGARNSQVAVNTVNDVGAPTGESFGIVVQGPFDRTDVSDNRVRQRTRGKPPPGAGHTGVLIRGLVSFRAEDSVHGYHTVELRFLRDVRIDQLGIWWFGDDRIVELELGRELAAVHGNTIDGAGRGPMVDVAVGGNALVNDNRVVFQPQPQGRGPAVLITADSAVISANYIETRPTAPAVRIHADTDKVAIATNVTNGTLRINGAALAAKWNAINVAT